jgi:small subunit ribosomal protein S7
MSRRRKPEPRKLIPDPRYGSLLVSQIISNILKRGKKSIAESIIYKSMEIAEQRTGQNGLEVLQKAINNVRPLIEVKSRRVGGATYQVPVEVKQVRSQSLAIRWILTAARNAKGSPLADRMAKELILASRGEGTAVKKREDTHKMAEANKAFAHFRW